MWYQIGLLGVVLVHFGWLAFVVTGWLYCARSPFWRTVHALTVVYGMLIEVFRFTCPLTHLEFYFRRALDYQPYTGDFIVYYLEKIIYLDVPQWLLIELAAALVLVTGLRYWRAVRA